MERARVRSILKKILTRALAVVFGLVFAWLVLEVALRVAFDYLPRGTQSVVQHVRRVPWNDEHVIPTWPLIGSGEFHARLEPGLDDYKIHWGDAQFTFDTIGLWGNADGFRTREPEWPMHIVALGDSFTFCWTAFDDCWVERLHQDYGWHVMNLGVPGTGIWGHRNRLALYVPPMEPAVVVMQWYGNDFKDDYDFARIRGEVEELGAPPPQPPEPDFGTFAEYSAVYRVIRDWLYRRDHPHEKDIILTVNGRELLVSEDLGSHDLDYESVSYGWNKTIQALEESREIVEGEVHAAFVIVLIPTKEEVYAEYLSDVLSQSYLDMLTEGRERLLAVCTKKGWHCLDMTPQFQAAVNAGETVYNALDFHLDASGNQILSHTLADYLVSQNWLINP